MTDIASLVDSVLSVQNVEYRRLGDVCHVYDSMRKPISKKDRITGMYPYYGASGVQDYVSDYIFEGTYLLIGEDGTVINSDGSPVLTWAEGKFWVNNHAHIIQANEGVDLRYLYYYLQCVNISSLVAGVPPKLNQEHLKSIEIAVPSLEIQHAIVEVLDALSSYSTLLSSRLDVRNAQLSFLRDSMLGVASDEPQKTHFLYHHQSILSNDDVVYVKVSELFNLRNGYTPSKAEPSFWTDGTIPWFVMDDIRQSGSVLADSSQHITPVAVKGDLFKADSIILSTSATIGYHALITVPFLCNQRFTCMTVKDAYKDKVNVKYLYHYMYVIDEWCKANTFQSSFQAVDMDNLKELLIPLPSMEVQDTIADLFDSATALIDNLANEKSARDIQYQYYRDLILSFGGAES